ncbi:MAG: hypothetical protein KIS67_25505 [Verrucomicrobiae bacterium]|nr:hypothetical protein [Verrucomicrobiae bacterium]
MSLAIVILLDSGAIVFTDSRSVTSDFSKSRIGVKKSAIITNNDGRAIVAFTGDGEINGKLTLDILSESAAANVNAATLPASLVEGVKAAFEADVANFPWENQADKAGYLRDARVVLHILTEPNKHHFWVITPQRIANIPFPDGKNEAFSGVRGVACFTGGYRHWDMQAVRSLVPNSIHELCSNESTCGYPVDVTVWKLGGQPEMTRCADLNALNAHLDRLIL